MSNITFTTETTVVADLIRTVNKTANLYHEVGLQWALLQLLQGEEFNAKADEFEAVFTAVGAANGGTEAEQTAFIKAAKKRVNASRNAVVAVVNTFATEEEITAFLKVSTTSRLVTWLKSHNIATRSMQENLSSAYSKAKGCNRSFEVARDTNSVELMDKVQAAASAYLATLGKHTTLPMVADMLPGLRTIAGFDAAKWAAAAEEAKAAKESAPAAAKEPAPVAPQVGDVVEVTPEETEAAAPQTEEDPEKVAKSVGEKSGREAPPALTADMVAARLGQLATEAAATGLGETMAKQMLNLIKTMAPELLESTTEATEEEKKVA